MANKTPRILYWDIETSLMPVTVFNLAHNDWINPEAILEERYVICGSWLLEGDTKVHSVSVLDDPKRYANNPHDDYHVVKTLHKVLSECDVLVHHNGNSFDRRYVETRALVHGLGPIPPITMLDTYVLAKTKLFLASNKLDYIARLLKVGKKQETTSGLWMKVLNGDKSAVREMISYNKVDVQILQKVAKKLFPYMANHINRELFGGTGCPRCGSHKIQSRGLHRAISRVYRRFQCQKCFGWFRSTVNEKAVKTTKRVL